MDPFETEVPPAYGLITPHVFPIVDSKMNKWAHLKLISRAESPSTKPTYHPGDTIKGIVSLDLTKERKLKKIAITIIGWIAASGYELNHLGSELDGGRQEPGQRFLVIKETVWASSSGQDNRFIGHHEWPIEIGLPPIIPIKAGSIAKKDRVYDTPPTFIEAGQAISVIYDLALDIFGAGIFNTDSNLTRQLKVVSARAPSLPSPQCIAAFQRSEMLPGPEEDPEGWLFSQGAIFTGNRTDESNLMVNCKMAFLKPLVYSRGRALLFQLILESSESNDYLSDPNSFQVCLVRNLSREKNKPAGQNSTMKTNWANMVQCSAMATLWSARQGASRKEFWGEFSLDTSLTPSFEFLKPSVQYFVVLLPLNIPGVTSKSQKPLIIQRVEIVTQTDPDFVPMVSYAPPNHQAPPKAERAGWFVTGDNIMVLESMFY